MGLCWVKCCTRSTKEEDSEFVLEQDTKKLYSSRGDNELKYATEYITPGMFADDELFFAKRGRRTYVEGEENVIWNTEPPNTSMHSIKCMDIYSLPEPQLKATDIGISIDEIFSRSKITKRPTIEWYKRLRVLKNKQLTTSQQRIMYFRNELQKKRISFLDDSITLVIDRNNIIEDTLNQIETTDYFDFHKEIKIFFIDEVAQDAGGVLKEWIFWLSKF